MNEETFLKETIRSIADLLTKELQHLDSAKVKTTAWIRFEAEV